MTLLQLTAQKDGVTDKKTQPVALMSSINVEKEAEKERAGPERETD